MAHRMAGGEGAARTGMASEKGGSEGMWEAQMGATTGLATTGWEAVVETARESLAKEEVAAMAPGRRHQGPPPASGQREEARVSTG